MFKYEVGKKYPELIKRTEGAVFDMTDEGANLVIYFQKPTKEETDSIQSGNIKYWLTNLNGIIWLFWKFGPLNALETPYHKSLSINLTNLNEPNLETGYAVNVILVDSLTGEIKAMRLISMSEKVSRNFYSMYLDQATLSRGEIDVKINECQRKYSPEQMIDFAKVYGRVDR